MSTCIFIVKEGTVNCVKNGIILRTLEKGEYFGELSIILETERTMDVIAAENCILYAISIDTLKKMVGEKHKEILFLNCLKKCFQSSNHFVKLDPDSIDNAFDCFKVLNMTKGNIVLKKGEKKSTNLIILIQGNIINVYIIKIT